MQDQDFDAELAKHFQGTPETRVREALRLGEEALDALLKTLPPGTTRDEAREIFTRNKNFGRTPWKCMDSAR